MQTGRTTLYTAVLLAALVAPPHAKAGPADFTDPSAPIAGHETKPSRVRMPPLNAPTSHSSVFVFSAVPVGAGSYDFLPLCRESRVRYERSGLAEGGPPIDMLFYAPEEKSQVERAATWKHDRTPYLASALTNPYFLPDYQQVLARAAKLECLPTRLRYVEVDRGVRIEYREGDRAWDDE